MKIRAVAIFVVAVAGSFAWFSVHSVRSGSDASASTVGGETSQPGANQAATDTPAASLASTDFPPLAERRNMSRAERLRWLEKLGQVPEDADFRDWELAQETSWWGKPLDRDRFWKDRVVWMDEAASDAARRRGRGYPPIPYEDPIFAQIPDKEVDVSKQAVSEGPNIKYRFTQRENAFWDRFAKTMPKPPESLALQQYQLARTILGRRHTFAHGENPSGTGTEELAALDKTLRERIQKLGYPPEALTDDALYWALVLKRREQYEKFVMGRNANYELFARSFIQPMGLDEKLITDPLTEEQLKAANAWKIAYLQRLRRENVDESYINAYLKAWNLTAAEVFGADPSP